MASETKEAVISVIMGVYNPKEKEELEQAVDSILTQTYNALELILYDDASCEQDAKLLRHLAEKDSRIRLLRGEVNRGLAHGLNECLKVAKGEYIARMDADDISAPERLRIQKEFLDTHKEYGFVGLNAQLFDSDGVWGHRQMIPHPGKREFLAYSPYMHPTVMFRKSVLQSVGGYLDSEDTRRCEDYELFMRLYCNGHYGCNMDGELFFYREDRTWYDKRKLRQRIAEMKIRYRGFRAMGLLNPRNMIYVWKPVLMTMIPKTVRKRLRNKKIRMAE